MSNLIEPVPCGRLHLLDQPTGSFKIRHCGRSRHSWQPINRRYLCGIGSLWPCEFFPARSAGKRCNPHPSSVKLRDCWWHEAVL